MNLPLTLGGVAALYILLTSKKSSAQTKSPPNSKPKPSEAESARGYKIVECKSVIIYDKLKTFDWAYQTGIDHPPEKWDDLLFDGCTKTPVKFNSTFSKFIFDMLIEASSGGVDSGKLEEGKMINKLNDFKDLSKQNGIDVSAWEVKLKTQK